MCSSDLVLNSFGAPEQEQKAKTSAASECEAEGAHSNPTPLPVIHLLRPTQIRKAICKRQTLSTGLVTPLTACRYLHSEVGSGNKIVKIL